MPTYDELDDLEYRKMVDARDEEIRRLREQVADLQAEITQLTGPVQHID